jgi:hypothetical protein
MTNIQEDDTQCKKIGYEVGDRFLVVENSDSIFDSGSVVELMWDDGSEIPLFRLISGRCNFHLANGSPGGYLHITYVVPYIMK